MKPVGRNVDSITGLNGITIIACLYQLNCTGLYYPCGMMPGPIYYGKEIILGTFCMVESVHEKKRVSWPRYPLEILTLIQTLSFLELIS